MQNFIVKSHNPKSIYPDPHFFILNKGMNSGKPLAEACPNCFVLIFQDQEEYDNAYWITYSLWKSNFWHRHLYGSVIPFLRIQCFKSEFSTKYLSLAGDCDRRKNSIETLNSLNEKESEIKRTLILISEMKSAILHQYLHG